ncbi:MAG: hypothetical protein HKO07_04040, partial [Pseudomonadales bacterium]|nr:hypothetical protein [Pseudomonadales bacterium]
FSIMPLWRQLDPLPIVGSAARDEDLESSEDETAPDAAAEADENQSGKESRRRATAERLFKPTND